MAKKTVAKTAPDKPKRPRDPKQFAHAMIQEMTDRQEVVTAPAVTTSDISRVMAELGRRGGKIGGKRRMDTLTQERRSQIAYKAAQARWGAVKKKA